MNTIILWRCLFITLGSVVHGMVRPLSTPSSVRVLTADVGLDVVWYPGDRRVMRRLTPMQEACLRSAAMEKLVSDSPSLVAMLPAVPFSDSANSWVGSESPTLIKGGGGRRVTFGTVHPPVDETATIRAEQRRRMSAVIANSRIAALCAVVNVRTAGKVKESKGIGLNIASATLQVVGRVAVRKLENVIDKQENDQDISTQLKSTNVVASFANGEGNAVLQDAWVDEFEASPVHAVHKLRKVADECARLHDLIRTKRQDLRAQLRSTDDLEGLQYTDVDMDRALFELAHSTLASIDRYCDIEPNHAKPAHDAYGDIVEVDPEIELLRCVSFAAWRAIRAYSRFVQPEDLAWAFSSRSTLDRLRKAESILRADLEFLLDLEQNGGQQPLGTPPKNASSFTH
uniref:Uncharacterized protein n=1 Tax=Aureoumbra lagunensis TaxID=44058 RepID=A0A7S3K3W0_9STRA|mmetsp:Transcript_11959/g.17926  ORF Transcript_11959/g.17926 Transcript_11959/m.17926 type:complete len:400 (+) Transcript_11959:54-1253(+)